MGTGPAEITSDRLGANRVAMFAQGIDFYRRKSVEVGSYSTDALLNVVIQSPWMLMRWDYRADITL
jgi:hypothetical protein